MSEIKPEYQTDGKDIKCPSCKYPVKNHTSMSCTVELYGGIYYILTPGHSLIEQINEARAWARHKHRRAMAAEKEARAWARLVNQQMQVIGDLKRERNEVAEERDEMYQQIVVLQRARDELLRRIKQIAEER